jgi:hypothetical protein
MRTFRDSNGTAWTVFEVRRQVNATGDKTSYLPGGFNDGWLCFETAGQKRRLTKYPARWRELGDEELGQLLNQAQPAPKASMRTYDDFGEAPNDARPE